MKHETPTLRAPRVTRAQALDILKWELMLPSSKGMAENLAMLHAQLDEFFAALERMQTDAK